jgi:hypothetical protein
VREAVVLENPLAGTQMPADVRIDDGARRSAQTDKCGARNQHSDQQRSRDLV